MNDAVERAIKFICEKYSEPLSLDDIADSAIMSRFHFCRTFAGVTGVTPGRFLSAVRIYEAKRKLLNTEMNVTDITFAVGFNSLGSFSNHFTDSVGVSPGRFRRISRNGGFELKRPRVRSALADSSVSGTIAFPKGVVGGHVFLGVFDTPIVQRQPVASAIVKGTACKPCYFQLTGVPQGSYFLRAVAVADTTDPEPWTRRVLLVGGCGVRVTGAPLRVQVDLRSKRPTDPPILLALPELEPRREPAPVPTPSLASNMRA